MKDALFDKALNWVESKGFKDIKANTKDYEAPASFSKPDDDNPIIPDITAMMYGNKSYIEIVSKDQEMRFLITKWKLLGTAALRKGGKLYLLAGRGYKAFADNIVKNYNLQNVRVVGI